MDESKHRTKERTSEERRFILWSIARANKKVQPGPFTTGIRVNDQEPQAAAAQTMTIPTETRQPKKKPQYYRHLLLSGSARVGAVCGGLIGLNFGLLAYPAVPGFIQGTCYLMLTTLIAALIGTAIACEYTRRKRIDLFHAGLIWCCVCPLPKKK